jgi:CRISPR/Cas system-associated endoribonuclease Cas2
MSKLRHSYVFAYDSPDDNRRRRALGAARAFSLDPQLSVHYLHLSPGETNELWHRIKPYAAEEDRLLLITIDPRALVVRLGRPAANNTADFQYLG